MNREKNLVEIMAGAAEAGRQTLLRELERIDEPDSVATDNMGAGGDMSTRLDLLSEQTIIAEITKRSAGDYSILTEEAGFVSGRSSGSADSVTYVVDPLDGTNNLKHRFPFACISIGAVRGNEVIAGVVADIFRPEVYFAVRGGGTYLRRGTVDTRVHVGRVSEARRAFVSLIRPVTSSDYHAFDSLFFGVKTGRIVVSAALELALVSSGRTDAFLDLAYNEEKRKGGVRLVDLCAGTLLVKEAGGVCWTDRIRVPNQDQEVKTQTNLAAASNLELLTELLLLRWPTLSRQSIEDRLV